MYRLTAIFEVNLPGDLRAKRAQDETLTYQANIDNFDVDVVLPPNGGARSWSKDEQDGQLVIWAIQKIELRVARDEDSEPPPVMRDEAGRVRDFTKERREWFSEREKEYKHVALTILNRLIRFFKFQMKCPHLYEFSGGEECWDNPTWQDRNGQELDSGKYDLRSFLLPNSGQLGEKDFTVDEDSNFNEWLNDDLQPEIFQKFLSDAQTSILSKRFSVAILELVIACEVALKQLYSGKTSPLASTFEFLDSHRYINPRVTDLLHGFALHFLERSFKDEKQSAYRDIDYLFRCRNKVVHRGLLVYGDESGEHQVDREILTRWLKSVWELMAWIETKVGV